MDPNLLIQYQNLFLTSAICALVAFLVTFLSMPRLIKKLKDAEIVGKDIHKPSRPLVAEMGGIGILFGFIIGIFLGIYFYPESSIPAAHHFTGDTAGGNGGNGR